MGKGFLITAALVSGVGLAVQVGLNSELKGRLGHPVPAAIVSFLVGTFVLLGLAAVVRPKSVALSELRGAPWWMWGGGLVGACYVALSAAYAAKLGSASWLALIITGQILTSVVLDHYGLIGFERHPVGPMRIIGAALLLAGVVIVLKS